MEHFLRRLRCGQASASDIDRIHGTCAGPGECTLDAALPMRQGAARKGGGGPRATYEAGIESRFILSLRGPITHIGRLGISGTLQVAIADARNSSPRDPSDLRRHVDEILTTMNSVSRPHGSIRGTLRYYPPKAGGALGPQQARSYAEIRRTNIL